ncbi:MAG: HAMP domain-containing sensor histidine kinase [Planctomycetota bacterium]
MIGHVDLVAQIIASQQSLAQSGGFCEPVDLQEVLDMVVKMQSHSISKYNIDVATDYEKLPMVVLEKHKLIQVLVNMITNAKQALRDSGIAHKIMRVELARCGEFAKVKVSDNGVGISAENLNHIFSHGFTTKPDGHGFGLHSCALAIQEMGGEIAVESEGEGQGASFSILVPLDGQPGEETHNNRRQEAAVQDQPSAYAPSGAISNEA